jgi:hypothetical protein
VVTAEVIATEVQSRGGLVQDRHCLHISFSLVPEGHPGLSCDHIFAANALLRFVIAVLADKFLPKLVGFQYFDLLSNFALTANEKLASEVKQKQKVSENYSK